MSALATIAAMCKPALHKPAQSALLLLAAAVLLISCRDAEDAIARGDQFWAQEEYGSALAEYRLALVQSGGEEEVLRRVAHAYIRTGKFERAKQSYDELIERSPEHADQAVYDYIQAAKTRLERGDRHGMAAAAEAALTLQPTLRLAELSAPLARYHREAGAPERALGFYERALATLPPDETLPYLYDIGLLHESLGSCEEAIGYFDAYLNRAPRGNLVGEARWQMGNCSFVLAREDRQAGRLRRAQEHLDLVLDFGVPANIQDQAWFEKGEILVGLGQFDEALAAYRQVLELNPSRSGQLVERAQRRIEQIRFGW